MYPDVVLSPAQVQDLLVLDDRPVPATPVLDLVIPPTKWKLHPSAFVQVNLRTREIGAIPHTQYGAAAFTNDGFEMDERVYKPRPIKQVNNIPGNVVADMTNREPAFLQAEIARILADHRDNVRLTKEAMVCAGIFGTFTYAGNTQAGVVAATQTAMGSVAVPTVTNKWDASGAKFSAVEQAWRAFQDSIIAATNGDFGNDPSSLVMLVGSDVWAALVALLTAQFGNSGTALLGPALATQEFAFGNMRIKRVAGTYNTYSGSTKSTTAKITAKKAVMIDLAAQHHGRYCVVEDIGANGRPMEFFAKQYENQNPSGLNVFSESKPFVFPDVRGIAAQEVLQ